MAFLEMFSLDAVADQPLVRLDLTRRQFLALAAFVDAFPGFMAGPGADTRGELPEGLSIAEVAEAWNKGIAKPNLEWAVSMLSLMDPVGLYQPASIGYTRCPGANWRRVAWSSR